MIEDYQYQLAEYQNIIQEIKEILTRYKLNQDCQDTLKDIIEIFE